MVTVPMDSVKTDFTFQAGDLRWKLVPMSGVSNEISDRISRGAPWYGGAICGRFSLSQPLVPEL